MSFSDSTNMYMSTPIPRYRIVKKLRDLEKRVTDLATSYNELNTSNNQLITNNNRLIDNDHRFHDSINGTLQKVSTLENGTNRINNDLANLRADHNQFASRITEHIAELEKKLEAHIQEYVGHTYDYKESVETSNDELRQIKKDIHTLKQKVKSRSKK